MKKHFLLLAISAMIAATSCNKEKDDDPNPNPTPDPTPTGEFTQNIDYTDHNDIIYNPDMGFFSSKLVTVTPDGVSNKESVIKKITKPAGRFSGTYNKDDNFDILLLKIDISAFSSRNGGKEEKLTDKALSDIAEILASFKGTGKTAFVQFAYDPDYDGKKTTNSEGKEVYADVEPKDFNLLLDHVSQIVHVVKPYQQYITAIRCGMVGPYGEMHSTIFAGDKDGRECGYIAEIMERFADAMQQEGVDVPLLVRQPRFMYSYINLTGKTDYKTAIPDLTGKNHIFGFFNDGYLGSDSDLGTFRKKDREGEIHFMSYFTASTPYGGEITSSSDKNEVPLWQSDLEGSFKEMFTIHLSFLNIGYKAEVFEALSETDYNGETAFLYLFKHMGYRYVITNSEIEPKGNSAEIRLQYRNDGFANMPFHRKKVLSVIFKPENGDAIEVSTNQEFVNAPSGTSNPTSIALSVSTEKLSAGKYTVYLKVSDADGDYPVRFANNLWNDGLKANKIGVIEK
ncbi:MAG: DUF4832 domain-containing protein [Bacteroidales bacterium]|nr:DUF4832 domain-containing protein [Bacteroidales bacterium]